MRQIAVTALVCALLPGLAPGQLTPDQKISDFQHLAGLYAKHYAPYEWKRDVSGFDLMEITPWLNKVAATRSDLEFYDVMSAYVASLNDAHDAYSLPSNFNTTLNFSVDVYDGVLLVDSINRTRLPGSEFPFMNGYELVSIDGVAAEKLLETFLRYNIAANDRSTRRFAAALLTVRPQWVMPFAPDVPEISTVVFRRPDGSTESHRIPWTRTGLPLATVGRYAAPLAAGAGDAEGAPDYIEPLNRLQNCQLLDRGVLSFGDNEPIFAASLGANFTLRLGRQSSDGFYSGIFDYGPYKIGFIRIPSFSPNDPAGAVTSFFQEVRYFQGKTDGLIVDVMRNPGGSVSYAGQLLSLLLPSRWSAVGFEIRASSGWVASISSSLESAKAQGAPPLIIAQLQGIKDAIVTANHELRGRTGPVPLIGLTIDQEPLTDPSGAPYAYTKPLMLLTDELSASAADMFAATIQDNSRGTLFGWRTMGAGGSVTSWAAGSYSQGSVSMTESLMTRSREVITPEFPATRYIENVGVRPDIEADYMTRDNLNRGGAAFVDAFLKAMSERIANGK
ncbi:MAG: hypothetical protein HZB13_00275 [Acidobacteria bacterium]|nr:hypothetical protein [Acidobacteriota bacterium]